MGAGNKVRIYQRVGRMRKEKTIKDDGRYLIYYSFENFENDGVFKGVSEEPVCTERQDSTECHKRNENSPNCHERGGMPGV